MLSRVEEEKEKQLAKAAVPLNRPLLGRKLPNSSIQQLAK
ncbi:MAG: hypothetical protein JWM36_4815 [Hyphomicrobiales bacterium]|nr:hypothetical protein [Hyphomicrobiales bacterium]